MATQDNHGCDEYQMATQEKAIPPHKKKYQMVVMILVQVGLLDGT